MFRKLFLPLLALALIGLVVGCSDNVTEPAATEGEPNLIDDFGGYVASDESPGFGNAELLEEAATDAEYDDPMLGSPAVAELCNNDEAGRYHFRAVWGRLQFDPTVTEVTDWTGSLTISRGAEVIRRVIRFEPGQDYIVPRTDRGLIEWISKTTVHNDGIAVELLVPPVPPSFDSSIVIEVTPEDDTVEVVVVDTLFINLEPVDVIFQAGSYSRTFSLEEISALDTVVEFDDGNAVAFHGLRLDHRPCPRGFMAGTWGVDDEGQGILGGFWMSKHGAVVGFIEGHYGVNDEGRNVFFGKVIDLSGAFRAFLRGTYGPHPAMHANDMAFERAGGWFRGNIFDAGELEVGAVAGRYYRATVVGGGFFQGRWKVRCSELARERNDSDGDGF